MIETVRFKDDDFEYALPFGEFNLQLEKSQKIEELVNEVRDSHENSWFGGCKHMDIVEFAEGFLEGYLKLQKDILKKLVVEKIKAEEEQ